MSKHDRLFTKEDVQQLINVARMEGSPPLVSELLADWDRNRGLRPMTFPPDEPVFVLRASDLGAPDAIGAYFQVCSGYGDPIQEGECSDAYCDSVATAGKAIEAWQREHPDRVKVPG